MAHDRINLSFALMQKDNKKTRNRYLLFILRILIWLLIIYIFISKKKWLDEHDFVRNLLNGIYTFIGVSILVSIGRSVILSLYRRRNRALNERNNFVLGISRIANILNSVFLVVGIMLVLDINPKEFLTSITIVAMAIALLFREYITNMISGLIIMFSSQYSLDDWIKWGEYQGEIIDITLANMVIRSDDDDTILVPNNLVFTSAFINRSMQSSLKLTVKFELPLAVSERYKELEETLKQVAEEYKPIIRAETFSLKVTKLEREYVGYKVTLILKEHAPMKELESKLLLAVLQHKTRTET